METVMPKSLIGKVWNWLTEKVQSVMDCCESAVMNAWNFCKTKVQNACNCSSSNDDDRYIIEVVTFDQLVNFFFIVLQFHPGRNSNLLP